MKPRKPIPRSSKRIRSRRSKPRRRAGVCRAYLDWLMEQPCQLTGKRGGEWLYQVRHVDFYDYTDGVDLVTGRVQVVVDPAHVRVKRLGGDLYNAVSLAHHLHNELHAHGIKTFAAKYGVDLEGIAQRQTEEFLELYPEHRPSTESVF